MPGSGGARVVRRWSTVREAAWAGHSVAVLLHIYAKCIVGQEDAARRRIDTALEG